MFQGKEARMGRPSKYPEEFRREAVELYRSSDRPGEVLRTLTLDPTRGYQPPKLN
jgi:hypothetical protein